MPLTILFIVGTESPIVNTLQKGSQLVQLRKDIDQVRASHIEFSHTQMCRKQGRDATASKFCVRIKVASVRTLTHAMLTHTSKACITFVACSPPRQSHHIDKTQWPLLWGINGPTHSHSHCACTKCMGVHSILESPRHVSPYESSVRSASNHRIWEITVAGTAITFKGSATCAMETVFSRTKQKNSFSMAFVISINTQNVSRIFFTM